MEVLLAMGMDEEQARQALTMTNDDVEQALELLLSGVLATAGPAFPPPAPVQSPLSEKFEENVFVCNLSQFSFGGGASACTTISTLCAFEYFRASMTGEPFEQPGLFEELISKGAAMSNDGGLHQSCEEVCLLLPEEIKGSVLVSGVVLQALISNRNWCKDLLQQVRDVCTTSDFALVLTKSPESICLIYANGRYALLDSHSRPQLGLAHAHIVTTAHEEAVCRRIEGLFPSFPADDLGEAQTLLYNAIDCTIFYPTPPSSSS